MRNFLLSLSFFLILIVCLFLWSNSARLQFKLDESTSVLDMGPFNHLNSYTS